MITYCAVDRNAFLKTVERLTKSEFATVIKRKTNSVHIRYGNDEEFDVLILHSQCYRNKNLRGKTLDYIVRSGPNTNFKFIKWASFHYPGVMIQTLGN